jgi:hypothetical protein
LQAQKQPVIIWADSWEWALRQKPFFPQEFRLGPAGQPPGQNVQPSFTWMAPGEKVTVQGHVIRAGMLYVSSGIHAEEASCIDLSLPARFDERSNPALSQLGYSPAYPAASPEARGAYIQWLAGGKQARDADIGFVFLYFYGLERRVLVDAQAHAAVALEFPRIEEELRRLLEIYSESASFRGYANSLLDYLLASQPLGQSHLLPPPNFAKSWQMPFALKLALAQFAVQEHAIPGEWAYAWWLAHPETRLKKPAERCPQEFKRLFIAHYQQRHGEGLRLRPNKAKLTASHRVANPSLQRRQYELALDLPDITVLAAPLKKLQAVADYCNQALGGYSRHLGRNPDNAGKIDALLALPTLLWPDAMKQPLLKIHRMVSQSNLTLAVKFEKLLSLLPPWETISKSSYAAFAMSLQQIGLGIEPDPRFGGGVPERQRTVVLFVGEPQDLMAESTQQYRNAALSLHFAVMVSLANGELSVQERESVMRQKREELIQQMQQWLRLGDGERTRLQAYLRWLAIEPPGLNGLNKRVEEMPASARAALGDFLILLAHADQQASPSEIKLLERIFKMLGLDAEGLYNKLHAPTSTPVTVRPAICASGGYAIPRPQEAQADGLRLDMAKVSELQEDTQRITALLQNIFGEQESTTASEPAASAAGKTGLLGLGREYSEFVRVLLSRHHWTRLELEELAADRSLLLDGSLEHINEAAFDLFGQALIEGDEPFAINLEIAGEIIA